MRSPGLRSRRIVLVLRAGLKIKELDVEMERYEEKRWVVPVVPVGGGQWMIKWGKQ